MQNLEVQGSIPPEIDGTFYRVMPDPQFVPFIENDPVSCPMLAIPGEIENSFNFNCSGSTVMATSVLFVYNPERSISSKSLFVPKSLSEREKLSGHC